MYIPQEPYITDSTQHSDKGYEWVQVYVSRVCNMGGICGMPGTSDCAGMTRYCLRRVAGARRSCAARADWRAPRAGRASMSSDEAAGHEDACVLLVRSAVQEVEGASAQVTTPDRISLASRRAGCIQTWPDCTFVPREPTWADEDASAPRHTPPHGAV